jgi:phage-related protein
VAKPLFWIGTSRSELKAFPAGVRDLMGFALWQAQNGRKHVDARPLKGFGGAAILEITEDDDGNTYRSVYTVRFAEAVYVLHAFQKKSKRGRKTPKHEIDLVRQRLKMAEQHYENWLKSKDTNQAADRGSEAS